MKSAIIRGMHPVDTPSKEQMKSRKSWNLLDKLLLGLTPRQYLAQAMMNPFNWIRNNFV